MTQPFRHARFIRGAFSRTLLLALSTIFLAGCVERALLIRSDPAGARVFLDGKDVGSTPARVPFDHYGTREVMVRWEPTERGEGPAYAPETRLVPVSAPWYQWFPVDLFSEFVWPGTIVDERVIEFTLVEHTLEELEAKFIESARAFGLTSSTDESAQEPSAEEPRGGQ
mgnify:CR=1 FL=1